MISRRLPFLLISVLLLVISNDFAAASPEHCKTLPLSGGGGFVAANHPKPVRDEAFTDTQGRKIRLSQLKGRPLLVNFWTTWCPPCIEEMPSMDRIQSRFKTTGLLVLPLVRDPGGTKAALDFYNRHNIKHLPALADRWGKVTHKNRIGALPQTMFVDRQGREVGRMIGGTDWEDPGILKLLHACLGIETEPATEK